MNLEDIWQANKRFFVTVGSGLLVFLIGTMIVESVYSDDVRAITKTRNKNRNDLSNGRRYSEENRLQALDENEALDAAVTLLKDAVAFEPREDFVVHAEPGMRI